MLKRILTGAVCLALALPVLIFYNTAALPVVMALLCTIGVYEMMKCIGALKCVAATSPLYVMALTFPIAVRYYNCIAIIMAISVMYLFWLFGVAMFSKGKMDFAKASEIFTTGFYIIFSFTAFIIASDDKSLGFHAMMIIIISSFITDIFAYFTGRFFGKHKLIEYISPKKTVEGSIGGTIFCIISVVVYGFIANFDMTAEVIFGFAVMGLLLSVVAQIGDLVMSFIKRQYGVKDYGKLLPGHGGVLDRFDSVMAVSGAMLFVCLVIA